MATAFNDQQVVQAIRQGGDALRRTMRYLYAENGSRELVFRYIRKLGGSIEDAEDVFQEAICALVLNVQRQRFAGDSSVNTYLVGIAKNIWRTQTTKNQRRAQREVKVAADDYTDDHPEILLLKKERHTVLERIFSRLGKGCTEVMNLWIRSFSIKEIVERTSYKNENVVSKKKHQCLQKLYDLLKENPDLQKELR